MKSLATAAILAFLSTLPSAFAFTSIQRTIASVSSSSSLLRAANTEPFELVVELPGRGELSAKMKFLPVLNVPSEIVEVRYKLPFGLDVAPKNNLAVCTKDGVSMIFNIEEFFFGAFFLTFFPVCDQTGGEKVGDVLRYTSQWTLGLPRGDGVITTAMSFSGGISWQVSMFDVARANRWDDVVAALVSNEQSRTDEVVLLFERPLNSE